MKNNKKLIKTKILKISKKLHEKILKIQIHIKIFQIKSL